MCNKDGYICTDCKCKKCGKNLHITYKRSIFPHLNEPDYICPSCAYERRKKTRR